MEKIKQFKIKYLFDNIFKGTNPQYVEEDSGNIVFGQRNNTKEGYMSFLDCKYTNDFFWNKRNEWEFLKYGDIIINSLGGGTCGRVGFFDIRNKKILTDGIPFILRGKGPNKYLYYTLKNAQTEFENLSIGATNQVSLLAEDLKNFKVKILIDPKEQNKIANYLDEKVTEIDNIIQKTKKNIEEYKLYKQSIITKTVTKGLNKDVNLKDSGIKWIEKIPENWDVILIKYILQWKSEKNHGEETVLSLYRDYGIIPKDSREDNYNVTSEDTDSYKFVEKGDFVINKMKAWQGSMAISEFQGIVSPAYHVCKFIKNDLNKKYFHYLLRNQLYIPEFRRLSTGLRIGQWDLGFEDFKRIPCILPPINEQNEIVKFLDKKCTEIDNIINSKEKLIEELENYKKSLIYEYVTGKKEVKNSNKGIKINCKDNIFAQAILLCKIIDRLNNYNLGRVKAEKTLYLIENDIGFDFNNKYAREAAGPLNDTIYKCESIISKKNKWVKVKNVKKHIEYEILDDFKKYESYYKKYYSDYDEQIEKIINIIKDCDMDKSEMIATLYAAWNDCIINKDEISDNKIIKDVRENWNDSKKRFSEKEWLNVLQEMKNIGLVPKGYGNRTIIKE